MKERQLKVMIATFSYGGNGGFASTHPDVMKWLLETVPKIKADPRVEMVCHADLVDTPITMTRNLAVQEAQRQGIDVLLMIDSDQAPDYLVGIDPNAHPFWDTSFDFLCKHYERGPCVIGSPYCGPPAVTENCYVFRWIDFVTDDPNANHKLEAYSRAEAANLAGIQECAALPTGLILFDMRAFDLVERPYFYYEWADEGKQCEHCGQKKPGPQAQKHSTEDVTATRDISFHGMLKLDYNPLFCNWSAWAGHWKPKCVGKPRDVKASDISLKYQEAVHRNHKSTERLVQVNAGKNRIEAQYVGWPGENGKVNGQIAGAPPDENGHARSADELTLEDFHVHQDDLEALKNLVLAAGATTIPVRVVEIGSFLGYTSRAIADAMSHHGGSLWCIDNWDGIPGDITAVLCNKYDVHALFLQRMKDTYPVAVYPIVDKSPEAVDAFENEPPLDMVFIDADHSYEAVKADIEAWLPKVKVGGILCGHDYGLMFPGVAKAVDEAFGNDRKVSGYTIWSVVVQPKHLNKPEYAEAT